jgi:arylsulfatase A-like enzyme
MSEIHKSGSRIIINDILKGAMHGIAAWMIYGIIEGLFSVVLPWIVKPHYEYLHMHTGFTAVLFILYPVLGFTIGGLIALGMSMAARTIAYLQKVELEIFLPSMVMVAVVLIFDVNLIVNTTGSPGLSELPPLAVSFLLVSCLLLSSVSNRWFMRFRFITNPWTANILLIGLPWVNRELLISYSFAIKTVGAIFFSALTLIISLVIHQGLEKRQIGGAGRSIKINTVSPRTFFLLIPLMFLVLGMNFLFRQTPLRENLNVNSTPLPDRPNVVLIVMDTVRADHLSLYGYHRDTTPNLQKFAEEATVYTNVVSPSDTTLSSHASMFTGMYAGQHGAHYGGNSPYVHGLDKKFHTLAEILSDKGYVTLGIAANMGVLGRGFGLDQGFQYYNAQRYIPLLNPADPYYIRQGVRNFFTLFAAPEDFDRKCRTAEDINREVFSILDRLEGKGAFFLFINYMDAHDPYMPPHSFDTRYPGKDDTFTTKRYRQLLQNVIGRGLSISVKEYDHIQSQYDGGIAYLDFNIGQLIKTLKGYASYENTLIIITSDHGEAFGERHLLGHGLSVYRDEINVPLIIKYPHMKQGDHVSETVSSIDIMPTVLDVLGYEMSDSIHGQGLVNMNKRDGNDFFSESYPSRAVIGNSRFKRVERAVISGKYKFIGSTAGKKELYDLSSDPDEKENLYRADDELSREFEMKLARWLKTVKAESSSPLKLDSDALERLKALGYIK